MKQYQLEAEAAVESDIEAAFQWFETEEAGLGFRILETTPRLLRTAAEQSTRLSRASFGNSSRINETVSLRDLFFYRSGGHSYRGGAAHCTRSDRVAGTRVVVAVQNHRKKQSTV